jgi:hypothetical protein
MPKTGTSSIQDSLYLGLADPRFRYIHLTGHANAGQFLATLFGDDPSQYWVFQRKGFSAQHVQRLKVTYEHRLQRILRHVIAAKQTAILSAEECWHFNQTELESLRDCLAKEDFNIKIIVYLRPFKAWIESAFQQNVKHSQGFTNLTALKEEFAQNRLNYVERLKRYEQIFGRENLIVRPFITKALINSCAVQDFCSLLDINATDLAIQRSNDAVCADAVRMLYCFNQFSRSSKPPSLRANDLLVMKLTELAGGPFRLHSDLLAPLRKHIDAQNHAIHQQYGLDLRENIYASDSGDCIRQESDLLRFSRSSLNWLNRHSDGSPIAETEGIATAHAVARKMAILAKRPSTRVQWNWLRRNMKFKLHGMVHEN